MRFPHSQQKINVFVMLFMAIGSVTFMNHDGLWYHYVLAPIFVILAVVSYRRIKFDYIEVVNGILWDRQKEIASLTQIVDAKLEWASIKITLANSKTIKIDVLDISVENREKIMELIKGHG